MRRPLEQAQAGQRWMARQQATPRIRIEEVDHELRSLALKACAGDLLVKSALSAAAVKPAETDKLDAAQVGEQRRAAIASMMAQNPTLSRSEANRIWTNAHNAARRARKKRK